jgi:DNA gyrase/topoisomerase IV subunit B
MKCPAESSVVHSNVPVSFRFNAKKKRVLYFTNENSVEDYVMLIVEKLKTLIKTLSFGRSSRKMCHGMEWVVDYEPVLKASFIFFK